MNLPWSLECSACLHTRDADGIPGVCEKCGQPYLVRFAARPPPEAKRLLRDRRRGMWRYREWLPLLPQEEPVTLGEGGTPLLRVDRLAAMHGFARLWVKDEGVNPTGSFKARGIALAAYAARAGVRARVYAPQDTPATITAQIRSFGAELQLLDGHIGDCGNAARQFAADSGAVDVSTLREPYRIEGKKTLGLELAEQMGWTLPDVIVYPTGGGTGLIGMWKAFQELSAAGWVRSGGGGPRFYTVQSSGCAPVVQAFTAGADRCTPWPEPRTIAAGLRVPGPLGDRLMLQTVEGIDAAPEGGAAWAATTELKRTGAIRPEERVVVFNTGAGWLYRT